MSSTSSTLDAAIAAVLPDMVALRHDIHQHPEPGFEERRTHGVIKAELERLGLRKIQVLAGTGIVADIEGTGAAGAASEGAVACIALRADMDALRMTEDPNELPYRSQNAGAAHMCGHDGHMASLVGAARLLVQAQDRIPQGKRVRLLFQPAEEGPGGALPLIEGGALEGVDEVYGYHNWPVVPLGVVSVVAGPLMAHVADFDIDVVGRGGHASTPHLCVDPVIAAAHVITALQTVVSRSISSATNAVVTVAAVHAGTTHNVIPDKVALRGTIRDVNAGVYETIVQRVKQIVTATAEAHGCTAQITIKSTYPVLVNHAKETEHVVRVAKAALGNDAVSSADLPKMGAEDFAYYLQHRPGCFYFLGGGEPGRLNAICHSTKFDFNDGILPISLKMYVRLVEDRLGVRLFA
eukprot:Unigene11184_Nuclearia_a/m.34211 Unigene11184_Nuclearia_a/g.34211  ORF Unigene11184_Nuclearia_a/g.34211 Unigene11184_Nuclearia_a/m.34211 type:complete len:409 (+) Unigene11184_Nuclearia_a:53-1279(+)